LKPETKLVSGKIYLLPGGPLGSRGPGANRKKALNLGIGGIGRKNIRPVAI
jgi:hypothetical protein